MKEFWLSFSFVNFLIINLFKSMCVYIFRLLRLRLVGQGIFTFIRCLFLHLELLLFITIFIHMAYYHFHCY